MSIKKVLRLVLSLAFILEVSGCGGGASDTGSVANTYTVGGAVTGFSSSTSLVLYDNGGDPLYINSNGSFAFKTALANGPYFVSIYAQPIGQTCSVSNGSGVINSVNVVNVAVSCTTNMYTVSGTVTGNVGTVTLMNNLSDAQIITGNGAFMFSAQNYGATYAVTIGAQPNEQVCLVSNGAGTVAGAVVNVAVNCTTNMYTVSGTVTGNVGTVTLMNNLSDAQIITGNGAFMFSAQNYGATYAVTIGTPPSGQTCLVSNGTGTVAGAVVNVAVNCTTYGATVSTLAGSLLGFSGSSDGVGTAASFNLPSRVAVGISGIVYVADTNNNKIRKITSAGVLTMAGSGAYGSADGAGSTASFNSPTGIAVDSAGTVYVADTNNNKIRKISSAGVVSTLAGSGVRGSADGTGISASFSAPIGVAVDSSGTVYVADSNNNKIRKITAAGVVSTLAGSGSYGSADGSASIASFAGLGGIAVDSSGMVYVADTYNNKIRKITSTGVVSTLAGSGSQGSADGVGATATFYYPQGVAVDGGGTIYVADTNNNKIRKITAAGVVSTLAGSGAQGGADGAGTTASFYTPLGIAVDTSGNVYTHGYIYVADSNNNRIRQIIPL